MRKLRPQAVARLAGFPVANAVGENDEILRRVQRLARPKKFGREERRKELRSTSRRPVRDEHGIAHHALRIALRRAERAVMDSQLRQRFAGAKPKIFEDEISLGRWRIIGRQRNGNESRPKPEATITLIKEDLLAPKLVVENNAEEIVAPQTKQSNFPLHSLQLQFVNEQEVEKKEES